MEHNRTDFEWEEFGENYITDNAAYILEQILGSTSAICGRTVEDDTPFLIFANHFDVSRANETVNELIGARQWYYWKDVYEASALLLNHNHPYEDLRLGNVGVGALTKCTSIAKRLAAQYLREQERALPYLSKPSYRVPDGIFEFEDVLVELGGERYDCWGFSDEYDLCSDCERVVRTSPNSYLWQPDFWRKTNDWEEQELICKECIQPGEYID